MARGQAQRQGGLGAHGVSVWRQRGDRLRGMWLLPFSPHSLPSSASSAKDKQMDGVWIWATLCSYSAASGRGHLTGYEDNLSPALFPTFLDTNSAACVLHTHHLKSSALQGGHHDSGSKRRRDFPSIIRSSSPSLTPKALLLQPHHTACVLSLGPSSLPPLSQLPLAPAPGEEGSPCVRGLGCS